MPYEPPGSQKDAGNVFCIEQAERRSGGASVTVVLHPPVRIGDRHVDGPCHEIVRHPST